MTAKKMMMALATAGMTMGSAAFAADLPGAGVEVSPIKGSTANAWFQHIIVRKGLEKLGYELEETQEADYPAVHLSIASGDTTYTFNHWKPLHNSFYDKSGGNDVMTRVKAGVKGAGQGFYIDKKTAEAHGITNIGQMTDPAIAALFDANGDGKANLSGCNPGWGCELVIEGHLDKFDLRDSIHHDQGSYFAIMADTITRYNEGGSIFYYTWTPNWISDVLIPGTDTVQIGVPASDDSTTVAADGTDPGFAVNDIYIVANNDFLKENPAAAAFFEQVDVPIGAINAQQVKVKEGEDTLEDFYRHAEAWIAANQAEFDSWVAAGMAAAN
ncbi:glycine betaine/proline transport system substrate-binding protein [Shimia gijangensis]|uniref:Glycine betaine/proline transport system substrate-binding protein n=1 Tax=Shimia gijangensis TaxID=1470563 RepID=A0A1M6I9N7_9RHOB|nr:glycine betaine/L-proline ABC transporter substrate-binding protein ProX [Shimia gijangensis]SHJ31140.1 glycine betaine/proline transport system substrate-binding protein [Shimia gijangensis]